MIFPSSPTRIALNCRALRPYSLRSPFLKSPAGLPVATILANSVRSILPYSPAYASSAELCAVLDTIRLWYVNVRAVMQL